MLFPSYEKESRPSAFTAACSVNETTRLSERASASGEAGTFSRPAAATASNKNPVELQLRWLTTPTFSALGAPRLPHFLRNLTRRRRHEFRSNRMTHAFAKNRVNRFEIVLLQLPATHFVNR